MALRPAWEELVDQTSDASIFSTWEWVSTWWRCFGDDYRLAVVAVYEVTDADSEALVGVAPFVISKDLKRMLQAMGNPRVGSDHLDLIMRAGYESAVAEAVTKALKGLGARWMVARLEAVRPKGVIARVVSAAAHPGLRHRWEVVAPYLALPASWEAFLSGRSRNFRYTLSRHERKLIKDFPARVVFSAVREQRHLTAAMQRLFALHQQVKEANGLPGAFAERSKQRFHVELAIALLSRGCLRLYELKVDDEVIASIYCFRYRDVVAFYQTGYSLDWARYRPGQQLMAFAVRSAIEEGAKTFDFLRGDEGYKRHWTDSDVSDENFLVANGWLGSAYILIYKLAKAVRRLSRRLGAAGLPA
jgi:CelD/BcsL family acetyltransferase involved in cellulose biosynthesis